MPPNTSMSMLPKRSPLPLIIAVVSSVLFIIALIFGIWAYAGMVENKSDLDDKVADASAVAVEKAEAAKEIEFAEREKSPFKSYVGTETYGSLRFSYPKNWSIFIEESKTGALVNLYAQRDVINGIGREKIFALRVQILATSYTQEADKLNKLAKDGDIKVTAFRPKKVPSELGLQASGEVVSGKNGFMVLLPQRDKTYKIWTESTDYRADFQKIIDSLSFVP